MRGRGTIANLLTLSALSIAGCARDREQPWRKALDEGRVVRLGGTIGKLSPDPTPAPSISITPPVIVQPAAPHPDGPTGSIKKPSGDELLPLPPPPKAVEKKTTAPNDDVSLGPPR